MNNQTKRATLQTYIADMIATRDKMDAEVRDMTLRIEGLQRQLAELESRKAAPFIMVEYK